MIKKVLSLITAIIILSTSFGGMSTMASPNNSLTKLWNNFSVVPDEKKTTPLWFWNDSLNNTTKDGIREMMVNSKQKSGYFGFAILPNWIDNYMSPKYLELYKYALSVAKELNMNMILYDENGYPSGQAGGLLENQYPEATYKRLDKKEKDVTGPTQGSLDIPSGEFRTFLGAVAMNTDTKEVINISDNAQIRSDDEAGVSASTNYNSNYSVQQAFDSDRVTRWNAAENNPKNQWIEINFGEDTTVNRMIVDEPILVVSEGYRTTKYTIQYFKDNKWNNLSEGTSIGANKEITFNTTTAKRFRLFINSTINDLLPSYNEIEFYNGNNKLATPPAGFDKVTYDLPEGNWKVMTFATVKDGDKCVDYLSQESVGKFINITYDNYYKAFSEYFGSVITKAFYDEPTLYRAQGRAWTPEFNELFEEKNGYNPITLYPAMWYDIGEDSASAREALYSFRADLYATNYIKQINDWCNAHSLQLTGHHDQEEPAQQTSITGDLIGVFRYQDIPGVDDILNVERGQIMYKVVSSAANNYDKPLVMSESFGAMGEGLGITNMYKDTMSLFTKGINFLIPHAIWYNNKNHVDNPPELSYRSTQYGDKLWGFNEYTGRLQTMLQNSRHVTDIAVLYPIDSLQSEYVFDAGDPYVGGKVPEAADYLDLGEYIFKDLHRDYSFLHPDVLSDNCTLNGSTIHLNNQNNYEDYKVLVMPAQKTISLPALQKIKQFYDNGGKVVATSILPYQSSEKGKNAEVVSIIKDIFGIDPTKPSIKYSASSVFNENYTADKAFDNIASDASRWNAADKSGNGQWLQVEFNELKQISRTVLKENSPYRVTGYHIQYFDGTNWVNCAEGDKIGASKENKFDTVTTNKLRLYVDTISSDSVSIQEFQVFEENGNNIAINSKHENSNNLGGKAIFLGKDYKSQLKSTLNSCLDNFDVTIAPQTSIPTNGSLTYIHKVKDNTDVFFFANTINKSITSDVSLRGEYKNLYYWNPHSGKRTKVDSSISNGATNFTLTLDSVKSVFVVDEDSEIIHTYDTDWTIQKNATCTETGVKYHICKDCNDITDITVIPLIPHSLSPWIITKQPTTSSTGLKQRNCTICKKTYTEIIPKLTIPKPKVPKNGIKTIGSKTYLYKNSKRITGTKVVTVKNKTYALKNGLVVKATSSKYKKVKIKTNCYIVSKSGYVQKATSTKYKAVKVQKTTYIIGNSGKVLTSGKKKYIKVKIMTKYYKVYKNGTAKSA